jgi:hypothetical protein
MLPGPVTRDARQGGMDAPACTEGRAGPISHLARRDIIRPPAVPSNATRCKFELFLVGAAVPASCIRPRTARRVPQPGPRGGCRHVVSTRPWSEMRHHQSGGSDA